MASRFWVRPVNTLSAGGYFVCGEFCWVTGETRENPIILKRVWCNELGTYLWIRTWRGEGRLIPEWFPHGLKVARACNGYGVLDPFELRIDGSEMTCIGPGMGRSLAEFFSSTTCAPESESYARFLTEQICYGLLRIHEGLDTVHGALVPFNVQISDKYTLNLWSVPTARLELSVGKTAREWESPYRSPRVQSGETPTVKDDVYSLGMIFARVLMGTPKNFAKWNTDPDHTLGVTEGGLEILRRSTHPDPALRFNTIREMAEALNTDSELKRLDIRGARQDLKLGIEAFRDARLEDAQAHFEDARAKDWLSLATQNNLAIARAAAEDWEEALSVLGEALKISPFHPFLKMTRGVCLQRVGSSEGDLDLALAHRLNPGLALPLRFLAGASAERGSLSKALKQAHQCLSLDPKSRAARILVADILDRLGQTDEAKNHRAYAENLPPQEVELFECLLSEESTPPWNLYLQGQDETLTRRLALDGRGVHRTTFL